MPAGCYEKAGDIDDSSGSFGDFVGQLHCMWIKARQAAGADAAETATRRLAWMEADPYGFCHRLERDAAKVLNQTGLATLIKQVRERFDVAGTIKGNVLVWEPASSWQNPVMERTVEVSIRAWLPLQHVVPEAPSWRFLAWRP